METENEFTTINQGESTTTIRKSKVALILTLLFGFVCFIFFLLLKLPEARIQNLLTAYVKIEAQKQGFSFSAESIKLGVFLGPSLKITNAELKSLSEETQKLKLDYLKISPKLTSLLLPVKKASVYAKALDGELSGSLGFSETQSEVDLDFDKINLTRTNILKNFLPIDIGAVINGNIDVEMDIKNSAASKGTIDLKLSSIQTPAQSVMGITIPRLTVSDAILKAKIVSGKIQLSQVQIGKNISQDSLVANIMGDIQLERNLMSSKLSLKAVFEVSKTLKESFPILESLLSSAKTSDNKYVYQFSGPIYMPNVKAGN